MTQDECAAPEAKSSLISFRRVVVFVILGTLVYALIGLYARVDDIAAALATVPLWVLAVMIGLSFLNYLIRYAKWQFYLNRIGVQLGHSVSFRVFLAGFTLTVTPAKIGEAVKGYFIYEIDGTPVAKTAPVVVSERVTDLLAMVLLAILGFSIGISTSDALFTVIMLGGLVLVGAIVLGRKELYNKVLKRLTSVGPLKRFGESCDLIEDTMTKTLCPRAMIISTMISMPGWFMECLELWILLSIMSGAGLPTLSWVSFMLLVDATFIHSASSVIGAVTFLPGGLGTYEATSVLLMMGLLSFTNAAASAATILIRFVTLWFSVVVGFVALRLLNRAKQSSAQLTAHQP
ncbi:MAG: hypothetical protein C4K49_06830 [Candidatus Thorarchaeota archaeon]|nr:MAG: hypothetical protein C4K49_06830 [Candidatus Thorarchaeota archaeon]